MIPPFLSEKQFCRLLCKNKKCLDIGPGKGEFLLSDPARRIGLDVNEKTVTSLQEKGLTCLLGSVENLVNDFNNNFDVIYMRNIIEHMNPFELAQCLQFLPDLCSENAIIILITPCEARIWSSASHIRPYPPVSIHKLLTSSTESYLYKDFTPPKLSLTSSYTTYNIFNCMPLNVLANLLFNSILRIFQFLVPTKFHSHYLMILSASK